MEKIIGILGIVLPGIIVLLGIARASLKKTTGTNGLMILCALLLLVIGLLQYFVFADKKVSTPSVKPIPLTVSKHTPAFNKSIEGVLSSYFRLTDALVNKDAAAINQSSIETRIALDSLSLASLQADTLIYETALQPFNNAKAEVVKIVEGKDMEGQKVSFNNLSNELYSLLRTVRYDLAKIYWKECPFAFGEGQPGNWMSKSEEVMNPYNKEDCADVKSTINFVQADSTAAKPEVN